MSFTRLTDDLNVIQKLPDDPNDSGGLSSKELKAKFDEACNAIKSYINSIFLEELESEDAAGDIGITTIDGIDTATNVQAALEAIMEAIQDISQSGIADGSVTAAKLATAAVETAKIKDGAVTSGKIADSAVATAKILDLAITAAKIASGAVTTDKIANGAVTADKVGSNAIATANIVDGAVNSGKLSDSSVLTAKLANNAVTAQKINSGAVSGLYDGTILVSGWTGASAPYTNAVTVSGILDTDVPIIDLVPSDNYETASAEDDAWGKIYRAVTSANTITFYAKEIPTVALAFKARCIRK